MATQSGDLTACLKDATKLLICYNLHDNQWKIDTSLAKKAKKPFEKLDRQSMYQQITGCYFNIPIFSLASNPNSDFALFTQGNWGYAFGAGSGYFTQAAFENLALYSDLFKTLNVSKSDFFLGVGGWGENSEIYHECRIAACFLRIGIVNAKGKSASANYRSNYIGKARYGV